jgi:hypothetical protein
VRERKSEVNQSLLAIKTGVDHEEGIRRGTEGILIDVVEQTRLAVAYFCHCSELIEEKCLMKNSALKLILFESLS